MVTELINGMTSFLSYVMFWGAAYLAVVAVTARLFTRNANA